MGKHAQLVVGPAGVGKSTYCDSIHSHCSATKRVVHVVNLDPAADNFNYPVSIDIRELISLEDVMSELGYGPNGGLVYCMEFLCQNMEWLREELDSIESDDCYILFDCPGQIELYNHLPVMRELVEQLQQWDYRVCGVYALDAQFVYDAPKFISGTLACLSAMIALELPHINVLTKCDLLDKSDAFQNELQRYLDPDIEYLNSKLVSSSDRFNRLNEAMANLLEEYSMVNFVPLDISDQDSIGLVLSHIDNAIQYGEDLEPKEPGEMDNDEED